ncbi:histidine kinase [Aquimarina sp. 2201CG5-10]|uniref:sensor histidine kinase n=1 Tax=Aquimarina callyspongiae TaxID=3098150 RepID=UPI002AB4C81A|nr:histidine kinase [Aquimarina sp. 2201CG5-10]MDY8137861.1 histidine kinase [Aquimarina sp. 2201CG5-10]
MYCHKLLYLLIFIKACVAYAQHPTYVHLSEKDALPDIEFYNIIEDSKGFIWLAADKGLYRYDGRDFKNYTNPEKKGLSVFSPKEDDKGRIWCNNISGQFFYIEDNKLITFIDIGKEFKGELLNFIVTPTDLVVFGSHKAFRINLETKEKKYLIENNAELGQPFEEKNRVLYKTKQQIVVRNKELTLIDSLLLPKLDEVTFNLGNSLIFKVNNHYFWKSSAEGKSLFFSFDFTQDNVERIQKLKKLEDKWVIDIYSEGNQVWFATHQGVYVFEYTKGVFNFKKILLKNKFITKIIKDSNANYWFTTKGEGIFVSTNIYVQKYEIEPILENISSLEKINDSILLFGTNKGGIVQFDTKTKEKISLKTNSTIQVSEIIYNSYTHTSYISKDDKGYELNHHNFRLTNKQHFFNVKSAALIDEDSHISVSFYGARFNRNGEIDQKFNKKNSELVGKRAYATHYSKLQNLSYIGFVDALVVFDDSYNKKYIINREASIFTKSITETTDGIIWVSTPKNGILGIKKDTVIANYTTKNGLISNQTSIIKSDKNSLWISTDQGIQWFNTENKTFRTLTKNDGIPSYKISGIEVLKNKVFFSSDKGLFSIDKDNVFKNTVIPKVYFTNIQINEKDTIVNSTYNLSHDQNAIKFSFNSNGFRSKENNRYTYRLLGENNHWVTTDPQINSVKYNSLDAGEYTFQVKSANTDKEDTSVVEEIRFVIQDPFWKKWWFVLLCAIIVGGIVIFIYKLQLKKKEKAKNIELEKMELSKKMVSLKLENLRSQMNPHFIFNALNSIQEYIILNQKNLASDYLGKFSDLIRTYLNHSNQGKITLQEEIDCLEMYLELEELRFEDKLSYHITLAEEIQPNHIEIPTMLVQPYAENALKHGLLPREGNGILSINFKYATDDGVIICTIEDNGVGREKSREINHLKTKLHTSFATKATQDRLDLYNYDKKEQIRVSIEDLFDDQNNPSGTRVTLFIPYVEI